MVKTDRGPRKLWAVLGRFRELNVLLALLLLWLFFYSQRPDVFVKGANLAVIMRFIATFGMLAIGEVMIRSTVRAPAA